MQRLRSTFKRSRTPTGAEMKSQSSLEVPKQVRSASFDEIQLEAQRQESKANSELKSIAKMAMATSSSLGTAAATTTSSSSSSYSPSRSQTTDYTTAYLGPGAVRKHATLRIPQLHQTNQRSKSFDVAAEHHRTSLLDRSSSTAGTSSSSTYKYVARWRSSGERENPPSQAYSCWHCACVDEYKASIGATTDSWEDDDDDNDDDDDDNDDDDEEDEDEDGDEEDEDEEAEEADDESACGDEFGHELNLSLDQEQPPAVQVERDKDNTYYFVVVQKAYEDLEDEGSDCSRREGSPEIRVTLSTTADKNSTDVEPDSLEHSEPRCELFPQSRQRRRSLSRQEALTAFPPELPAILGINVADEAGQSSPDEDEDENDDSERTCAENKAANLVVRDIFLTVPDLRRDRAASVDSCFNNNKNGKIDTGYSLTVPQQSVRSKSVDIVLPTEAQTRYTALLPGNDESRVFTG